MTMVASIKESEFAWTKDTIMAEVCLADDDFQCDVLSVTEITQIQQLPPTSIMTAVRNLR